RFGGRWRLPRTRSSQPVAPGRRPDGVGQRGQQHLDHGRACAEGSRCHRACRVKTFCSLLLMMLAAASQSARADEVAERGRYLSVAADCVACHTSPKQGKPYAGGYAIASPLGEIWASNITPSRSHGIGLYSEDDFAKAVREGVRKDGAHLYPAMPYTSYAKLTD